MAEKLSRLLRNAVLLAIPLTLAVLAAWCGCERVGRGEPPRRIVERDTVWLPDTILVFVPTTVARKTVRDTVVIAPILPAAADSARIDKDSAAVSLPVVSRHYGDSLYDAWVSGPVDPRLDSLRLYPRNMVVRETVTETHRPSQWGLSLGAGLVAGPGGIGPGVFIGVTYTIPFRSKRKEYNDTIWKR